MKKTKSKSGKILKTPKPTRRAEEVFPGLREQESVMDAYRRSGAVKSAHQEGLLHMFFSPFMVPKGLTKKEVAICIKLRRFREIENNLLSMTSGSLAPCLTPIGLPRELYAPDLGEMTRERFISGITKYKSQVLGRIAHFQITIGDQFDKAIGVKAKDRSWWRR